MKATIYTSEGKEKGSIELPANLFEVRWNPDLVHQVVTVMQGNTRKGTAHTKDRGEVRGGGRKPWQQKGTGRARHGSSRSPIWRHGGVTFGPRNDKNYHRDLSKNMKTKALFSVLSKKIKDGELLFIDNMSVPSGKSKDAKKLLSALGRIPGFESLGTKKRNAAILAFPQKDEMSMRGFKNFGNLLCDEARNLNALELMKSKYVVVISPEKVIETLTNKLK